MWSGVVPQQPPTMLTKPFWAKSRRMFGNLFRRLVITTKLVGRAHVGIATHPRISHPRHHFEEGANFVCAERAVQTDAKGARMFDGDPEGFGGLSREAAPAEIDDCAGDHQWHFFAACFKNFLNGGDGGFAQSACRKWFRPTEYPRPHPTSHWLARRGCALSWSKPSAPHAGVVDIRREGGGFVGWPHRTRHKTGLVGGERVIFVCRLPPKLPSCHG